MAVRESVAIRGGMGHRLLRRVTGERAVAIALIIPSALAVGLFVYGFIGWSVVVSLSKWNTVRPDYTFVGLDNFRTLFHYFRFQIDIRNTVVFTVFSVGACLGIGLLPLPRVRPAQRPTSHIATRFGRADRRSRVRGPGAS